MRQIIATGVALSVFASVLACGRTEVVEPREEPLKTSQCDSCYQIQELNFGTSANPTWLILDTVFGATPADTVRANYYGWFNCGIDTTIYTNDTLVRNRMWCQ